MSRVGKAAARLAGLAMAVATGGGALALYCLAPGPSGVRMAAAGQAPDFSQRIGAGSP